jgi:hypothetical protein
MDTGVLKVSNIVIEDEYSITEINISTKKFKLTETIVYATIGIVYLYLLSPLIFTFFHDISTLKEFKDQITHIYLEIIPFWATVSATVLGYYFFHSIREKTHHEE